MTSNSALTRESGGEIVLDARSRGRYDGTDPEPRPGLSSGHIPNSLSLPFNMFLQTQTSPTCSQYTTFKTPPELRNALLEAVGEKHAELILRGDIPIITTCGSGMTAAVLWLGLRLLNVDKDVSLYDESWTGYALRSSSKIEKSA